MHLHLSPAQVDALPLDEVNWTTRQLVNYIADTEKWFREGGIGYAQHYGSQPAPSVIPQGFDSLPVEKE